MYLSRCVVATVSLLTFSSLLHAKQLEFVPEKRKPAAKSLSKKSVKKYNYSEFPEILSYNELMSLSPTKRVQYIFGLRAILEELSLRAHRGRGTLVSDSGLNELFHPEEIALNRENFEIFKRLIEAILPSANASGCSGTYGKDFGALCGRSCAGTHTGSDEERRTVGGVDYCFPKSQYLKFETKYREQGGGEGISARLESMRQTQMAVQSAESVQSKPDPALAEAKERLRVMQLNPAARAREEENKDNALDEMNRKLEPPETPRAYSEDVNRYTSPRLGFRSRNGLNPEQAATGNPLMDQEINRNTANLREKEYLNKERAAEAQPKPVEPSPTDPEVSAAPAAPAAAEPVALVPPAPPVAVAPVAPVVVNPVSIKPASLKSESAKAPEPANPTFEAKPAVPTVCSKQLIKCEAKFLEEGGSETEKKDRAAKIAEWSKSQPKNLSDFRDKKIDGCISSGNMSKYNEGKIKAGNCGLVSSFCFNPEDEQCLGKHKYEAGESRKEREALEKKKADEAAKGGAVPKAEPAKPVDKGIDKNKVFKCKTGVICNPLVFGAMAGGEGICVPSGGANLTVNCKREAEKAQKEKGDQYVADIMKKGAPGVANAWDDWRDQFKKLCGNNSASQLAHCEECMVIGQRLRDLKRITDGSCDNASKYKDMPKPAEAAPAEAVH